MVFVEVKKIVIRVLWTGKCHVYEIVITLTYNPLYILISNAILNFVCNPNSAGLGQDFCCGSDKTKCDDPRCQEGDYFCNWFCITEGITEEA